MRPDELERCGGQASASRLGGSESTSYAATNFRNWTAASGEAFTSGWRLLACLNASRTVTRESDGVTPWVRDQ